MSKGTNDKDISDLEREFEEEIRKEELPEESRLPEETELEREYDEEMKSEELPEEKKLDPFAEKFYELSSRTFKTETELNNAVNEILNEIERDYFFKGLFKKTKKAGQFLLKKGLKMFKGFPAFQAAKAITQLARGNLKGTLGTLAKVGLKGVRTSTGVGAALPILNALGFEIGKGIEQNREAWQNFTNVCKESFDYLARNLNENADDPIEASRLASEAFSTALKKVESERQSASMRRIRKMAVKTSQKKVVGRTVVIALGMVCIVLLAGLVGAIAFYTPMINNLESQTAQKDNTISSLNNTISSLNSQISALNNSLNQISSSTSSKDTQIAALNAQISSLTNILYLNASTYLANNQAITQDASAYTTIWNDTLNIAGYVTVAVQSSSTTTYVEVAYSAYGVNYDNNVTVGTSGTAAFPVLPGTIGIRVGNTELVDSANATVTAIYYY
jgi:uncharacterized coiled-coil protein SlyX